MECTRPYFRVLERAPNPFEEQDKGIFVPCGKCLACRINRRREWTQRLLHEAAFSSSVYFLTLTYNEEDVPYREEYGDQAVCKADVQKFFKDLRNACRCDGVSIRYFLGSEYGDLGRPHYHAIVYNMPSRFVDQPSKDWRPGLPLTTRNGKYLSKVNRMINDIWKHGFVSIGEFNRQRAGYVAKYFVDKADAPEGAEKNFSLMSRRPGIGNKYAGSIASKVRYYGLHACMADNGKYLTLPRYYDKKIYSDEERADRLASLELVDLSTQIALSPSFQNPEVAEYQIRRHHNNSGYKKQL